MAFLKDRSEDPINNLLPTNKLSRNQNSQKKTGISKTEDWSAGDIPNFT